MGKDDKDRRAGDKDNSGKARRGGGGGTSNKVTYRVQWLEKGAVQSEACFTATALDELKARLTARGITFTVQTL